MVLECLSGDPPGPVGLKVTLKTREHVGGVHVTESLISMQPVVFQIYLNVCYNSHSWL